MRIHIYLVALTFLANPVFSQDQTAVFPALKKEFVDGWDPAQARFKKLLTADDKTLASFNNSLQLAINGKISAETINNGLFSKFADGMKDEVKNLERSISNKLGVEFRTFVPEISNPFQRAYVYSELATQLRHIDSTAETVSDKNAKHSLPKKVSYQVPARVLTDSAMAFSTLFSQYPQADVQNLTNDFSDSSRLSQDIELKGKQRPKFKFNITTGNNLTIVESAGLLASLSKQDKFHLERHGDQIHLVIDQYRGQPTTNGIQIVRTEAKQISPGLYENVPTYVSVTGREDKKPFIVLRTDEGDAEKLMKFVQDNPKAIYPEKYNVGTNGEVVYEYAERGVVASVNMSTQTPGSLVLVSNDVTSPISSVSGFVELPADAATKYQSVVTSSHTDFNAYLHSLLSVKDREEQEKKDREKLDKDQREILRKLKISRAIPKTCHGDSLL